MLSVRSASFHQRIGELEPSNKYSVPLLRVRPACYPTSARNLRLLCLLNLHSIGKYDADLVIQAWLGQWFAYPGLARHLDGGEPGLARHFLVMDDLSQLMFREPGTYDFEILLEGTLEYSLSLELV